MSNGPRKTKVYSKDLSSAQPVAKLQSSRIVPGRALRKIVFATWE